MSGQFNEIYETSLGNLGILRALARRSMLGYIVFAFPFVRSYVRSFVSVTG